MAAYEWYMRQPQGGIPYSPDDVAIAEAQAAKQTVSYENSGQTPPTQNNTHSLIPRALQAFVGIVVLLVVGMFFFHKASRSEGREYDGGTASENHVVAASVEAAVG